MNNSEFTETNNSDVISKGSLRQHEEWGVGNKINVDAELIASQKWHEMVDLTQKDELERGIVVSWNGKKISTSKVILGSKGSFSPPLLPHGLRSLLPTTHDLVYIHTHYMPQEINHVKTTTVSDKDINSFINLPCKAMVMIDKGGVHMLTRKPYNFNASESEEPINIVDEAIKKAKSGGNTAMDVIREVAISLEPLGIKYYYSESLITTSEGTVVLKDATKL